MTQSKISNRIPWGLHPSLKESHKQLQKLIPIVDKVDDGKPYLERLRQVGNVAYDLFNNGLLNRREEFFKVLPLIKKKDVPQIDKFTEEDWRRLERELEPYISSAILNAWQEQFPNEPLAN